MATALKAIETVYKGYRFRSRLEARWALCLDALEVPYEYEPQGFVLPSGNYLPDFWLPREEAWLEVKPNVEAADLAKHKAAELAAASDHNVWVTCGDPAGGDLFRATPSYGWAGWPQELSYCVVCQRIGLDRWCEWCGPAVTHGRDYLWKLQAAKVLARQARFEFGSTPDPRLPLCPAWPLGSQPSVYLAGKVWTEWREPLMVSSEQLVGGYRYAGPRIVDRGHGGYDESIVANAFEDIRRSRYVFAWMAGDGLHGTLMELGYAHSFGSSKGIFLAFPSSEYDSLEEMWFARAISSEWVQVPTAECAWALFHQWVRAQTYAR